ncbi:kynurenine formamidase-like [Corticium candelabrum]|uniref:kynurenine formamidase-like n=1 Tax=Corticium candelabrum TaxID=121492 RepID=UPI002E252994|nr:kynurenine formamidase-like [Corticium candelabrum]
MAFQEELERLYSPSQWNKRTTPDEVIRLHMKVALEGTQSARQNCKCEMNTRYGDNQRTYDVYYPETVDDATPVFIYIHGGYWQMLSKDYGGFMAETFTRAGCIVVGMGYPIAPGPLMSDIVDAIKVGIAAVRLQFSKQRIYICGHSAGAHLAAMVLSTSVSSGCRSKLAGAFLVSGVYDLVPLVNISVNDPLHMTDDEARQCSPQYHVATFQTDCNVLVVVAENESPAFKQQSQTYTQSLQSSGVSCRELLEIEEVDHFNVAERLSDPHFELTQTILSMMGMQTSL